MRTWLLSIALLAGCGIPTTTRSNPPPQTAAATLGGQPYAGRAVLEVPGLDDTAAFVWAVIARRLALLGVVAELTFDGDELVVDAYGIESVAALAIRLADPMRPAFVVSGQRILPLADARVDTVERARAGCECKASVLLELPSAALHSIAEPPPFPAPGDGASSAVEWTTSQLVGAPIVDGAVATGATIRGADVKWVGSGGSWYPVRVRVFLSPDGPDIGDTLWWLGGGSFEAPPRIARTEAAQ